MALIDRSCISSPGKRKRLDKLMAGVLAVKQFYRCGRPDVLYLSEGWQEAALRPTMTGSDRVRVSVAADLPPGAKPLPL
jgi:hypothetical protein